MIIYNLGSINIDQVYTVPHFPQAGETLATRSYMRMLGGKGANQSIALAKAGAQIMHIGAINAADEWLTTEMQSYGVDCGAVQHSEAATGHAIVTVNAAGENQILLHAGANAAIDIEAAIALLAQASNEDWVLLQNETNGAAAFVAAAKARGVKIAYSAAPFDADIALALLPDLDLLVVNEGEAAALAAATNTAPDKLGVPHLVITKGVEGATYFGGTSVITQQGYKVDAIDTTGAGDCFYGYFLAAMIAQHSIEHALRQAAAASALQVTKAGAAEAIPSKADVLEFIETQESAARS